MPLDRVLAEEVSYCELDFLSRHDSLALKALITLVPSLQDYVPTVFEN